MKIPNEDVPQADTMSDIIRAVESVNAGAKTFQEIAEGIGKVDRQGRYYRRAAEILGLLADAGTNHSIVTPTAQAYLTASENDKRKLLAQLVVSTRIMQRVIPFFEGKWQAGVTKEELQNFIFDVTDTTKNMVQRRTMTILAWLQAVGVINDVGSRYYLQRLPESVPLLRFDSDSEPRFPKTYELSEYQAVERRVRAKSGRIIHYVDEVLLERANSSHQHLVNLMASRIKTASAIPKQNRLIDLSASIQEMVYLFEMKSTSGDNVRAQARKGLSQLYEYRYVQDIPDAKLVLVFDKKPDAEDAWLIDYLSDDRGLLVAWDGNDRFDCPTKVKAELPFI